jgi:hypothetical protein
MVSGLPDQTRSMMVAVPMPAPMHRWPGPWTCPCVRVRRARCPGSWRRWRPAGGPMAMAPPLTLTLVVRDVQRPCKRSTTVAKASFISYRSMSPGLHAQLAQRLLAGRRGAGQHDGGLGADDGAAISMRARGFRPRPCPASLLPTAAPAPRHRRCPTSCRRGGRAGRFSIVRVRCPCAVASKPMVPIISNEGISLASDSTEVPGRMVSSRPSIVRPLRSLTGTIELEAAGGLGALQRGDATRRRRRPVSAAEAFERGNQVGADALRHEIGGIDARVHRPRRRRRSPWASGSCSRRRRPRPCRPCRT